MHVDSRPRLDTGESRIFSESTSDGIFEDS